MKFPDLSFVIPAYNAEAFLSDCILSCLRQSHKNIEVVVVDDGSTDSTRRVIEHFHRTDTRVVGVLLPKNYGRGHARNLGNETARAPVLAVLDADDMADVDRAKITLDLMDKSVFYGAASIVDSMGNQIGRFRADTFDLKTALEKQHNLIVHSTMAYPAAITGGAKYDEGEYAEAGLDDWKFQLDLALGGAEFKHTDKILSAWRESADQVTNVRDIMKVCDLKAKYMKKYAIREIQ